ncbi:myoneurin-like isoform X1 [Scylla paramamosain]
MDKTKTEIIMEADEMEDGSIFVCFMCEKEFNKVSLLNEHMQQHQNMPEMHKELPSRRKGRGKPGGRTSSARGRGNVHGQPAAPLVQVKEEPIDRTIYIKSEPADMFCPSPVKKAERIRQYFQSRGRVRPQTKRPVMSDDGDGLDDPDLQLMGDDLMMVPPPTKKSSFGPCIMTPEPEGFICPSATTSSSSSATSSSVGRPRKNVKIRKKLIVQEVVYEEVQEDEDSGTNGSCEVNSGRRKESFKDEDDMDDEDDMLGETIELTEEEEEEEGEDVMEFPPIKKDSSSQRKPGRRSQPRVFSEERGIPCQECGKEFRSVTTLRVHMKAHLEVREIPCPYCDETFPQRHVLHQHLVNAHEQSINLTCPVCQKVFTRTDSLKSHMVRMHEEDGGLTCYICGKNFPSQGQLEMHVRVHTGERPFKCEFCSKGFVQKVHLRTHLRTMHNIQEIQNTPCRICNAMLDGRAGLREHYNMVHGLTNSQYKSRVAKLRKEGKIPELPPPVVKEVDPSLNYHKVNVSEVVSPPTTRTTVTPGKSFTRRGAARLRQVRKSISATARVVNSETSAPFEAMTVKVEPDDVPKRRDQEELNIVESAFKVAEQMDQLEGNVPGSTTILVAGEDSATTGVYYAIPVVMDDNTNSSTANSSNQDSANNDITNTITTNGTAISSPSEGPSSLQEVNLGDEDLDDEYAQFAAEHSHLGSDGFNSDSLGGKGSIVKAEPLSLFTDPSDPSQTETVEMFTM